VHREIVEPVGERRGPRQERGADPERLRPEAQIEARRLDLSLDQRRGEAISPASTMAAIPCEGITPEARP
jgi:hypothetical protein